MNEQPRQVILIPSNADRPNSIYWEHFVTRIRQAILRDGLECDIRVVPPKAVEPTT